MRILACHNFYSQAGGEDKSFRDETDMLISRGEDVVCFEQHNGDLRSGSKLRTAARLIWSRGVWRQLESLILSHRPQIVHCHNTFPKISDIAYRLAEKHGIPVVQTLRSYRVICPASSFLRESKHCELCIGRKLQWPAVQHACYQGKRLQTAVIVARNYKQRDATGGIKGVRHYIALTEAAKQIFKKAGYPEEKISVKPNFVSPDPAMGHEREDFILFVGRLNIEKGVPVMLSAWQQHCKHLPLVIIGSGTLNEEVRVAAQENPQIRWLGELPHSTVMDYMRRARALLMPSVWQETFGRTLIEAFATGTPVVASDHGAMAEIVENGVTGIRFETGSADACGEAVLKVINDPERWRSMSEKGRETYVNKYGAEGNYQQLLEIYRRVGLSS